MRLGGVGVNGDELHCDLDRPTVCPSSQRSPIAFA